MATLEHSEAQPRSYRRNPERAVSISAYTGTGYNTVALTRELLGKMVKLDWPAGYRYEDDGEVQGSKDSFAGFGTVIIVAVFGIMAVLVLELDRKSIRLNYSHLCAHRMSAYSCIQKIK